LRDSHASKMTSENSLRSEAEHSDGSASAADSESVRYHAHSAQQHGRQSPPPRPTPSPPPPPLQQQQMDCTGFVRQVLNNLAIQIPCDPGHRPPPNEPHNYRYTDGRHDSFDWRRNDSMVSFASFLNPCEPAGESSHRSGGGAMRRGPPMASVSDCFGWPISRDTSSDAAEPSRHSQGGAPRRVSFGGAAGCGSSGGRGVTFAGSRLQIPDSSRRDESSERMSSTSTVRSVVGSSAERRPLQSALRLPTHHPPAHIGNTMGAEGSGAGTGVHGSGVGTLGAGPGSLSPIPSGRSPTATPKTPHSISSVWS